MVEEVLPQKPPEKPDVLNSLLKLFQVIAVVVGVIISVWSFNDTRKKEAEARIVEAAGRERDAKRYADQRRDASERQRIEAAKPFLELRQKAYLEAVHSAAILSNQDSHSPQEIAAAKKRFRELYVAELSMVEDQQVARSMMTLAGRVDPSLNELTDKQIAALVLAHALRDSLAGSWKVDPTFVEPPHAQSP